TISNDKYRSVFVDFNNSALEDTGYAEYSVDLGGRFDWRTDRTPGGELQVERVFSFRRRDPAPNPLAERFSNRHRRLLAELRCDVRLTQIGDIQPGVPGDGKGDAGPLSPYGARARHRD